MENKHRKSRRGVPFAEKVMVTVFWDVRGILLVDYLQKGRTINAQYIPSVETKNQEIKPGLAKKVLKFTNEVHVTCILFIRLDPLPTSATSQIPKKFLLGKSIGPIPVIATTKNYFADLDESATKKGSKHWSTNVCLYNIIWKNKGNLS